MAFQVVAAKGSDHIALRSGNQFWIRTPYDEADIPIRWDGDDPQMMIAALVTKWGFDPVLGDVTVTENQAPILEAVETPDGRAWRATEIIDMETGETSAVH